MSVSAKTRITLTPWASVSSRRSRSACSTRPARPRHKFSCAAKSGAACDPATSSPPFWTLGRAGRTSLQDSVVHVAYAKKRQQVAGDNVDDVVLMQQQCRQADHDGPEPEYRPADR